MGDRDRDLETIRATYARYAREGRGRIWDPRNPGFARIIRDRDGALSDLLRASLPPEGGRVLDLGAGDGRLAEVARAAGVTFENWTGVDLDPGAVVLASAAMPWATWVEASADELPFEDGSFDVVVASTLFSSLPSADLEARVAAEIGRVLCPGAWLLWYDLRYDNPANRGVHGIDRRRLRVLFPGWSAQIRTMTLLPPVARRLGRLTAVFYRPLEALPLLRSHFVGRIRRPGAVLTAPR
ncbi:MAG: class I SAM-dependent methyltransferase [Chloroflexi bacterium]|nr:class I SAM-dependent methyltransferase [Chloroflexota bacterium]